ncbi:MAG: DinB family protein [Chloroflexi bacterium]|nr:DinB family protein [Chloroflexota bacterium]
MFTDISAYINYFEGAHRRTVRDVSALPPEAVAYFPETGEGEKAWGIGEIVRHIAGARLYFTRAYRDEGWFFSDDLHEAEAQEDWVLCLEQSANLVVERLSGTPSDWLTRKIQMIDSDRALSGWRILMMCLEHEVHHRSQIDTYAGLQGWDVPHIYGRSAEQVGLERERQKRLHSD